ncbi:MAG: hypothetical protein FWD18_08255 [Micrococcales bacterium]|nr:hypothetical protein [Micrococcales bacterium]
MLAALLLGACGMQSDSFMPDEVMPDPYKVTEPGEPGIRSVDIPAWIDGEQLFMLVWSSHGCGHAVGDVAVDATAARATVTFAMPSEEGVCTTAYQLNTIVVTAEGIADVTEVVYGYEGSLARTVVSPEPLDLEEAREAEERNPSWM